MSGWVKKHLILVFITVLNLAMSNLYGQDETKAEGEEQSSDGRA